MFEAFGKIGIFPNIFRKGIPQIPENKMLGVGGNFGAKTVKYECMCQFLYLCLCLNYETTILIQNILLKSIQLKDLSIISGVSGKGHYYSHQYLFY